jgi:DNA-binding transcriptional LysR family regulator
MQDLDWNDLRYVLSLSRTGRIAAAARKLGVNETTVTRRIARIVPGQCGQNLLSGEKPP